MTINIGINGYGRIGRNILRALYESKYHNDLKIVAINDVGDNSVSAHLTMYDSAHGKFNKVVKADEDFMYVATMLLKHSLVLYKTFLEDDQIQQMLAHVAETISDDLDIKDYTKGGPTRH